MNITESFNDEIIKLSSSLKSKLPWAIARGGTGALSTFAIGAALQDITSKMKHKGKKAKSRTAKARALLPLAAIGGSIGLAKGIGEKTIERAVKKFLKI